ncbi:hypothetical protein [Salinisphaera sp. G21_0]|uniref:hypothetical protein n=1 Tax=Salinisphaera sp. G21_0 TaxID=2821094 RepID=UPI001ADBAE71|nr:hypothetical protein [Salinisphaera sp. G21_0]MBO9482774.1 hypothetical protein [Salinisphaera sp. G21_0]
MQNIRLNNRKVTPDEVIQEFNREPDRHYKYKLAIVRFKEECCLRGLPLKGQKVTTNAVVQGLQSVSAILELARFKELCCLRGLALNGQKVTPNEVVQDYRAARANLELARFKAECCLKGVLLNGQRILPDAVVKDFPDNPRGKLGLARFKADCCLNGLALNGQQVTADVVVKDFQAVGVFLELAHFKEQCCLRGLALNGREVTPDEVVQGFPNSPEGKLGIARFKEKCCLRGLELNGRQVTPDEVDFPDSPEGLLGMARFRGQCWLKSRALNGQLVTPDEVSKGYQAARATLELIRLKEQCCLLGQSLNGQQVTPEAVVKDYQEANASLELARFKQECCLKKLPLNGQQVTPDEVVKDFPDSLNGRLGIARFRAKCCLMGLLLNDQQVTPQAVIKDYERGGWWLERAIFYAQLALNARELNGSLLDNQKVLEAFNKVPGDNSSRQVRYLIQRLKHPQQYHETNEAREILQTAWQILNSVSSKDDEQHRLQSLLQFMAMYHELPIDCQRVSAEQVYQSLTLLRSSFQNSRLHFFFLSHCHITRQSVNGRHIHKSQVLECLQSFPAGTALRHALGFWFEQSICEANLMENILYNLKAVAPSRWDSDGACGYATSASQHSFANEAVAGSGAQQSLSKQWSKTGEPAIPDTQLPRLHALKLKTLEIIQEVNRFYADPPILITGSYARFLQNRCSLFIDIDIQCTSEESARRFLDKLQILNTDSDTDIPQSIIIWAIPGCQATKQPKVYSVHLNYGDLGTKVMGLHISVDTGVTDEKATQLAAPGVERTFSDLSFAEQIRSLNDMLGFLVDNLDLLTVEFQKGAVFELPETLLFNNPKTPDERIYGLLTCALMSLSYGRDFIALHSSGGKPDLPPDSPQEAFQRLHTLTANLQTQLNSHAYRVDFELIVKGLLSTIHNESDDDIERKDLIKLLLEMLQPPGEGQ